MKIRHERPMSDLSFQVRAPLGLELVTGECVTISSWSLSGFEFPTDVDVLPKEAVLSIPFQGVDIRFPVKLTSEPGSRFCAFSGLSGRQRETMAIFYRSILSGRMASTEDVITSLDTPVDLVPMEETEDEAESAKKGKSPRAFRAFFAISLYAMLAAAVFGTIFSGMYAKLATVDIQNARIEAPLVAYLAPDTAYVKDIAVEVGQSVAVGDTLVRLVDPEGEAALADVRSRVALVERRLALASDKEGALAKQIDAARAQLLQLVRASPSETLVEFRAAITTFEAGLAPDTASLFEARAAVLREIDALEDELRRLRRERGRLRDAAESLFVVASEAGTITEVRVLEGQLVGRASPVIELEGTDARWARGWVDQSMASAFYPGMEVRVAINAGAQRQSLKGRVETLTAGVDPEISPDFGMLVQVSFPEFTAGETRTALLHLMPVVLKARRAWAVQLSEQWQSFKTAAWG